MPRDDFDNWRMYANQLDEYVPKSAGRKRIFQTWHPLALEVDYLPGGEDWIRGLARGIRGIISSFSALRLRRLAIDNPQKISEWKTATPSRSGRLTSSG